MGPSGQTMASFPFKKGVSVYLLAYLKPTSPLYEQVEEIRTRSGITEQPPHLTLHAMHLNADHPRVDDTLRAMADGFKDCYESTLGPIQGETRTLEVLGDPARTQFLVLGFEEAPFIANITAFRMCMYKSITTALGALRQGPADPAHPEYTYYSDANTPVYAVQDIYRGTGRWKPHISICRLPAKVDAAALVPILHTQGIDLMADVEKLVLSPSGMRKTTVDIPL